MLSTQWNSVNFVLIVGSKLKKYIVLENVRNNHLILNKHVY